MAIELLKSKLVLPPLLPGLVARPHLLHLLDQGLLTKLTLQGRTDLAQYIQDFTGSNRYILDYLMEEVLERQPTTIQDFLIKTSILKRISAPLCEALYQEGQKSVPIETERLPSDRLDFPDILGSLERANVFVIPLDDQREWYRYHHLFADLLRKRLHQTQAEQVAALHRRASRWLENHGMVAEQSITPFKPGKPSGPRT